MLFKIVGQANNLAFSFCVNTRPNDFCVQWIMLYVRSVSVVRLQSFNNQNNTLVKEMDLDDSTIFAE